MKEKDKFGVDNRVTERRKGKSEKQIFI